MTARQRLGLVRLGEWLNGISVGLALGGVLSPIWTSDRRVMVADLALAVIVRLLAEGVRLLKVKRGGQA